MPSTMEARLTAIKGRFSESGTLAASQWRKCQIM